jgi:hypothetical protein
MNELQILTTVKQYVGMVSAAGFLYVIKRMRSGNIRNRVNEYTAVNSKEPTGHLPEGPIESSGASVTEEIAGS